MMVSAETLKLEKSRKRVKSLSDEGVKLRKELKDTMMSHESSLKSKNKGITELEERVGPPGGNSNTLLQDKAPKTL